MIIIMQMKWLGQGKFFVNDFVLLQTFRLLLLITCSVSQDIGGELPVFSEPITNITTTAGRNIKLACTVDNLQNYQVTWSHLDTKTLLAMHNRVITGNKRYRVSQSHSRTWWLEIDNVQQRDSGHYMCQVNTSPMMSQVGRLQVVVPPEIDDKRTSIDMTVSEKTAISLQCHAYGYPKPTVSWQREDGKSIFITRKKMLSMVTGSYLNITSVNRKHMGAYLCIAANGVPPSVSKRIQLRVKFPPRIEIPSQLVGAPSGTDIKLECDVEVYPKAMLYWTRNNIMIISNSKYNTISVASSTYRTRMALVIRKLHSKEDFGNYVCHVESALGKTNGSITLYETKGAKLKSSSSISANFDKESNVSHNALARTNSHSGKLNGDGFRVVKSDLSEDEDGKLIENKSNKLTSSYILFIMTSILRFNIDFV